MIIKKLLKTFQSKKVLRFLTIIIISYSVFASILVSYVSFTFFETVESISVPSGYFAANLNSSSPLVETSFSISNTGIFECYDLRLEVSFEVEYFKNDQSNSAFSQIMLLVKQYDKIQSLHHSYYLITSSESDFNITNLIT